MPSVAQVQNRARFIRETITSVRCGVGDAVVGMRISLPTDDDEGIHEEDFAELLEVIELDGELDYLSIVAGTSADAGGAMEIVPALSFPASYLAPRAARLRALTSRPLMLTGRINEPQEAERILVADQADLCGMTRALICDPDMPHKIELGRVDDVRACIACNQACIGHEEQGYPVSCIQYPETGREHTYRPLRSANVHTISRCRRRGAGRHEGGRDRRSKRPRRCAARGLPPSRRTGNPGRAASRPWRVRWPDHEPRAGTRACRH